LNNGGYSKMENIWDNPDEDMINRVKEKIKNWNR
jgi:hypothetical protein